MKINVNYLFHCKKGSGLIKINIMCKLYMFLFLPCPRVPLIVLFIATIVQSPDIVQILGLLVILQFCIVSVCILFWI